MNIDLEGTRSMPERKHQDTYSAWLEFVRGHVKLLESAKNIPSGAASQARPADSPAGRALRVVVCSPHPDDECLIGAFPLRLRAEMGAQVTNLAITFGSNVSQRERRLGELKSACRVLGFDLVIPHEPLGFEHVNLQTRAGQPEKWAAMVKALSTAFGRLAPDVVFAPHAEDWHPAHIGTHFLTLDALRDYLSRSGRGPIPVIETSYWRELEHPNLMVGVSPGHVALLVAATAEHAGEVSRNAYHLRLPSRLIENVRRGAETVGTAGCGAPDFPFAELYRVTFVSARGPIDPRPGGVTVGPGEKIDFAVLQRSFQP